jgi:hypothetical protein
MWQNPSGLKDYTGSRNTLSTSRTTLQVDENFQLNENNSFFMREWLVYEPVYSFNANNNFAYSHAAPKKPHGPVGSILPHSCGHYLNDALNQYAPRDAWWQTKLGPLTVFTGNQTVVWGQSIAFRVGDVINPNDTAWAFGFANLEQSRKPQWMVHPLLYLPEWGPFGSNFLEAVWLPGWAPQWWTCDYDDGRYLREGSKCGRMLTGQPSFSHTPQSRFDVHKSIQFIPSFNAALKPFKIGGPFTEPGGGGLLTVPLAKMFRLCTNLETALVGDIPGVMNWANRSPVSSNCQMLWIGRS